ncbi:sensor histidine kinase N-terminal domain-containing protein [Acidovorax sp. FG27]|uniref:sensor histidine kinase n=1 Tax=Acidovorax sp. FG27 TaxID=3133652 RepID=UPI0033424C9E
MSRAPRRPAARSLRRQLLVGILVPVIAFVVFNTLSLYRETLDSLHTAYDRTLLASTKSISEQLDVSGYDDAAILRAIVPYSALETFEADNQSRMFYRVSNLHGELVSGFAELPVWRGRIPARPPYSALVDFYDDEFRGQPVRVAVLLQPVSSPQGRGMAVIQVAETLELRQALALQMLWATVARQALLVAAIALIVVLVVQRATRPVRQLSAHLQARSEEELDPITAPAAPRELQPLIDATNGVMQRLAHLLEHQKRFVRDASHQLRTPLAVLKTQVQSALRGDAPPDQALREIGDTVDRATQLANQMLALAKVEQLRQQSTPPVTRLDTVLREVALDLSPLVAQNDLDFGIHTDPAPMQAHEWMLRELTRNLLHNAVRHAPPGSTLTVDLRTDGRHAALTIADQGPGIDAELATRLFQPFSAGDIRTGSGLGLAICQEIVQALGGSIALVNRLQGSRVEGLDAIVRVPLAAGTGGAPTGGA